MKTILLILVTGGGCCWGQEKTPGYDVRPKTKLETFLAQDGVVIVQGFTEIGKAVGMFNSSLTVDSKEFTTASTGKKEYGMTIEVTRVLSSGISRESISYVDYDEIESLIKGIDYISKLDKNVTKLTNFQADYRTKGELTISVYNGLGDAAIIYFDVSSGKISRTTATFKLESSVAVRDLFIKAKAKIDSIK